MARPRKLTNPEVIEQMVSDYTLRGATTTSLAEQWSTTPSTIRRYLVEAGVQMRPRGRRPQEKGTN